MASELTDDVPFTRRKYDWDTWFNGKKWLLRHGEDFKASIASMINMTRRTALMKGLRVELVKRYYPVNADGSLNMDPEAPVTHPDDKNGCWTLTIKKIGRIEP